ncbi:hypothetical protein WJX72_000949 [[Myrmecia] bisecta]|uniref:Uncharacterized protein n=1 Tax=[Myrmecia] bisecta TaxID=41462 RepID=A0AAW1Q068_9CHLO
MPPDDDTPTANGHSPHAQQRDFVVAIPTNEAHSVIVAAGRSWRQGIRAFIASDAELSDEQKAERRAFNETWCNYPNDEPLRSYYPGDSRAALVPFLAHRHFGETYKWMLYGDDDTMWFLNAASTMVHGLDPEVPYFLTDHMWWGGWKEHDDTRKAHSAAPLCVPCGYHRPVTPEDAPFRRPQGCPHCSTQLLCDSDWTGLLEREGEYCRLPPRAYSMHGGAGAIFSVGLLRQINFTEMEQCVLSQHSSGSDAFVTFCLWQAGIAATSPHHGLHPKKRPFFDSATPDVIGEDLLEKYSRLVQHLLQAAAGNCTGICTIELEHTVSMHVRSRPLPSLEVAAEFLRFLSDMYGHYTQQAHNYDAHRDEHWQLTAAQRAEMRAHMDMALHQMYNVMAIKELAPEELLRRDQTSLTHSSGVESGLDDASALVDKVVQRSEEAIARGLVDEVLARLGEILASEEKEPNE